MAYVAIALKTSKARLLLRTFTIRWGDNTFFCFIFFPSDLLLQSMTLIMMRRKTGMGVYGKFKIEMLFSVKRDGCFAVFVLKRKIRYAVNYDYRAMRAWYTGCLWNTYTTFFFTKQPQKIWNKYILSSKIMKEN